MQLGYDYVAILNLQSGGIWISDMHSGTRFVQNFWNRQGDIGWSWKEEQNE